MPNFSSLSITIRRSYLFSSTIVGYARVVIDNEILLKEIPIFRSEENVMVLLSSEQVAGCPEELDINMVNRMIYHLRELIEMAIINEYKKQRNGTVS